MTIKEIMYRCDSIRPGYAIIIKLGSSVLAFKSIYEIPFSLADKKVRHFEVSDRYAKFYVEE